MKKALVLLLCLTGWAGAAPHYAVKLRVNPALAGTQAVLVESVPGGFAIMALFVSDPDLLRYRHDQISPVFSTEPEARAALGQLMTGLNAALPVQ